MMNTDDTRSNAAPAGLTRCILCHADSVERFLDLGSTALANKFLSADRLTTPEPKFPLAVGFCHTCTHVQLTSGVAPQAMFEHYLYVSSASDTLIAHFDELSATLVERLRLAAGDRVMDIGCNDGSLLRAFRRRGLQALGVDPAANLASFTAGDDIDRHVGFFNAGSADHIVARWGRQSLITATNTFPHIPLLDDFVAGILKVLEPGGAFVIEAHYLIDILDQLAFDTIYHEHISYWSLGPMTQLFERHGMQVVDAERLPIHHGQIRVTVQRAGEGAVRPSVGAILEMERARGLREFATFEQFAREVQRVKTDLHERLDNIRREGGRVAAYGAPAKGNTLISYLDVGPEHIGYIADRSPLKQGLFTPGSHIPVVAPDRLLADQPDYVLLLAWNFRDEILPQQAEYRRRGGKFIVPLPTVAVV